MAADLSPRSAGLGLGLARALREPRRRVESALLEDLLHLGIRAECLEAVLIPVEQRDHVVWLVRITKELRSLASMLLALRRPLGGKNRPELVEVVDPRHGQDHHLLLRR